MRRLVMTAFARHQRKFGTEALVDEELGIGGPGRGGFGLAGGAAGLSGGNPEFAARLDAVSLVRRRYL
jgi:hypothetical protein